MQTSKNCKSLGAILEFLALPANDNISQHIDYVMIDMSKLEGYKDRSYVAGWPYMKYYAEVPVHSPAGHTIGTLCVVDNKPRDGLDLKGLSILKEISNTIMSHLELCVSNIQRNERQE